MSEKALFKLSLTAFPLEMPGTTSPISSERTPVTMPPNAGTSPPDVFWGGGSTDIDDAEDVSSGSTGDDFEVVSSRMILSISLEIPPPDISPSRAAGPEEEGGGVLPDSFVSEYEYIGVGPATSFHPVDLASDSTSVLGMDSDSICSLGTNGGLCASCMVGLDEGGETADDVSSDRDGRVGG